MARSKKRAEGTLEARVFDAKDFASSADLAAAVANAAAESGAICGLPDFLRKAHATAKAVLIGYPREALAHERARSLIGDLRVLHAGRRAGADTEEAMYAAVSAGMSYASLIAEMRDDERGPQRLTRAAYFKHRRDLSKEGRPSRALLAARCGLTMRTLERWEVRNLGAVQAVRRRPRKRGRARRKK
jgi:hypothetical protein